MITYSHQLYVWLEPMLGVFELRRGGGVEYAELPAATRYDAVLFGLGRYGARLASELRKAGLTVLGVDFDPDTVRRARADGQDAVFGDASDPEFVSQLPLVDVRWAIAAVPEHGLGLTHEDPRLLFLKTLHGLGFGGRVAIAAHSQKMAEELSTAGADLVLRPFEDAAVQAAGRVLDDEQTAPETTQRQPTAG